MCVKQLSRGLVERLSAVPRLGVKLICKVYSMWKILSYAFYYPWKRGHTWYSSYLSFFFVCEELWFCFHLLKGEGHGYIGSKVVTGQWQNWVLDSFSEQKPQTLMDLRYNVLGLRYAITFGMISILWDRRVKMDIMKWASRSIHIWFWWTCSEIFFFPLCIPW